MPLFLDTLLALNGANLPPVADAAKPMPVPYAPVNLGPLSTDTTLAQTAQNPEPVPPRFFQPAAPDMNFVNQYAGAAPTPPQQPSGLQRVANALIGFGAGIQGNGPQFLNYLQQPQQIYQAQNEAYQQRRGAGLELAERRADREAAQANQIAEAQYQREFAAWQRNNADADAMTKLKAQQAFQMQRDAAKYAADQKAAIAKDQAAKATLRDNIATKYGTQDFAPANVATELADAIVYGKPISAATEKWRSVRADKAQAQADKLQAQIGRLNAAGGAGVALSRRAQAALANFNGALEELKGIYARGENDKGPNPTGKETPVRQKLDVMLGRLQPFSNVINSGVGTGGWPYAQPRNAPAQPAAQATQPTTGKTATQADLQEFVRQNGGTIEQARQKALAAGYTIQ